MRSYILSKHEREMLLKFIKTGEKTYGFDVLRKRIRDYLPQIEKDLQIISEAKNKYTNSRKSGENVENKSEVT